MAEVYISNGVGKAPSHVNLLSKYGEYKVGRWAKAPYVPDRCDFCPLDNIRPAVGFIEDSGGWRLGYCAGHEHSKEA